MTKEKQEELGRFIARTRESQGKSLRALAESAGLSPGSLSEIENGRRLAQPDSLGRIAAALDINWEDLYALAGYGRPESLPSFVPYLRSKYGDQLSEAELHELERFFRGTAAGRDEADDS